MASSVNDLVVSFDYAIKKYLRCPSGFDMSRVLKSQQKEAISTVVSRKDLLAVLPACFGRSLIFQVLVYRKVIMMGNPSSIVVVRLINQVDNQTWFNIKDLMNITEKVQLIGPTSRHSCLVCSSRMI